MNLFPQNRAGLPGSLCLPFLSLALALVLQSGVKATVINVPADRSTIQAGIDAAATGDTVLVAPGYYLENITFQGKEIMVSSHFLLNRDPAFIFSTTIDGRSPSNTDSASTVRMFSAGTEAPILQGFSITGGQGTRMRDPTEGSINRSGGGIATRSGAPIIRFNYIHHNQTTGTFRYAGGGVYLQLGNPVVENNIIMYNTGRTGCGFCVRGAQAVARNNVILYNSGGETFGGAGMYLYQGRIDGYNNTIAFNRSQQPGGGVRVAAGSIYLWNSIVWGNTSTSGYAHHTYVDPAYGGTIALQYSDVESGYAGTGNIDADPGFTGSWCFTGPGSPCIDAGDPDVAMNDQSRSSDPMSARWPSRGGPRNDMGACGGPVLYPLELAVIYATEDLGWVPWGVGLEAESYFDAESWSWVFGDGQSAVGQSITHTYTEPGAYNITLRIGHGGGEIYEFMRSTPVCALADTMWVAEVELVPETPVEILVQAKNHAPLNELYIPITYTGDLQLVYDGFSTVGCRTAGFDTQWELVDDPLAGTVVIELLGDSALPPGTGPVLKLLFHTVSAEHGQTASLALASALYPAGAQFVSNGFVYPPGTRDGSARYDCCVSRVGDANAVGGDEPTISDISTMIDALFIWGSTSVLPCLAEADLNQSGGANPTGSDITISDISILIDYLFLTGPPLGLPGCL